jgi:hypothetical protein
MQTQIVVVQLRQATRLWISQQNQGHHTGRVALPAALVSHAAMSGIGTYKTTFATLAAISFLGALGQAINA